MNVAAFVSGLVVNIFSIGFKSGIAVGRGSHAGRSRLPPETPYRCK